MLLVDCQVRTTLFRVQQTCIARLAVACLFLTIQDDRRLTTA
jgi:hypothetical protein